MTPQGADCRYALLNIIKQSIKTSGWQCQSQTELTSTLRATLCRLCMMRNHSFLIIFVIYCLVTVRMAACHWQSGPQLACGGPNNFVCLPCTFMSGGPQWQHQARLLLHCLQVCRIRNRSPVTAGTVNRGLNTLSFWSSKKIFKNSCDKARRGMHLTE